MIRINLLTERKAGRGLAPVAAAAGATVTTPGSGALQSAVLGTILRVRRHGSGVDMHGERADVAEHDEHRHADEQPGR